MRAHLVALAFLSTGCVSEYHPEYHPVTVVSYEEHHDIVVGRNDTAAEARRETANANSVFPPGPFAERKDESAAPRSLTARTASALEPTDTGTRDGRLVHDRLHPFDVAAREEPPHPSCRTGDTQACRLEPGVHINGNVQINGNVVIFGNVYINDNK